MRNLDIAVLEETKGKVNHIEEAHNGWIIWKDNKKYVVASSKVTTLEFALRVLNDCEKI